MIKIEQLRTPIEMPMENIPELIAAYLHISTEEILDFSVKRRSIDARYKPSLSYVYTVHVKLNNEKRILRRPPKHVSGVSEVKYTFPYRTTQEHTARPVVVGMGPAGLFAGLLLSEAGFRPILLERGEDTDARTHSVARADVDGKINPVSNVQFGEGGAGTFSDGKLTTLTHDKEGRGSYVLQRFVEFGARPEILFDAKPHVGTDKLRSVVKAIRKRILSLGGEVHFLTKVNDLKTENGKLTGVCTENGLFFDTDTLILAIGHSARDTFSMLFEKGLFMEQKPFAVGFRIIHPQQSIDLAQYGQAGNLKLPPAAYKLTHHASNGRGVYTFCMCPGGYVINASSEEDGIVVNGMSYSSRSGAYANSAVIATVSPADFLPYEGEAEQPVFSGAAFQRHLEREAFRRGEGVIPVSNAGAFLREETVSLQKDLSGAVMGKWNAASLTGLLPESVEEAIREGIFAFGRKIDGFADPQSILCGVESRTSSPVRILREERLMANIEGVIPAGEGCGYAGGILSAAVDGIRAAEAAAAHLLK